MQEGTSLLEKARDFLVERQKKIEELKKEDEKEKQQEIKRSIRTKLALLFSFLILSMIFGLTYIAIKNQTTALLEEKRKQGEIILKGLIASLRTRLLDIYALNREKIKRFRTKEDYLRFYKEHAIAEVIFEDIDQVKLQPDVVYAFVLGKYRIVLGHSDPKVAPYKEYPFPKGVESYFTLYQKRGLKDLETILLQLEVSFGKEEEEVLHFISPLTFKEGASIEEAIGEVHLALSLKRIREQILETTAQLQLLGVFAVIFGIFSVILFSFLITRPIKRVIEGMRRISQGDFSIEVKVKSSDEVGLLSRTFNNMIQGLKVLVSPEVAQVVLSTENLVEVAENRIVTVLFSDIRSFTTISEALTPHQVVEMLNEYLDRMTAVIQSYGGVIDKFVGDEIFAVFGAPFEHPLHPLAACAAGLGMGEELRRFNQEREEKGLPPIRIGIGINTGEVISGAIGSSRRIDYTSIGDTVNLGARLEGVNKVYGTLCILSEFTYQYVREDVIVRELDLIRVKGKEKPVCIYELLALTPQGKEKIDRYRKENGLL